MRRPDPVVVGAGAVGVAPVLGSLAHLAPGWVPASDVAVLTVRSGDVLGSHTPLLGMPSTASEAGVQVFHPGPLQLWATGLARVVWDGPATPLVVAVAASVVGLVVALAIVRRHWGPTAMAAGAGLAALLGWSLRGEVLASPFNPYAGFIPFCAFLVVLLAATEGARGAAPAAVALGAWAAQTHLVYPGPVMAAAAVALVVVARRRGWTTLVRRPSWPTWALLLVCWSGPILDVLLHGGGNVRAIARREGDDTLGLGRSIEVLVQAIGPRPAPAQAGAEPFDLLQPPAVASWIVGLLVLATLAGAAARARGRTTRTAAAIVLAALAATTVLLGQVPDLTFNALALHNYLPLWPLVLAAWAIVLFELVQVAARRWAPPSPRAVAVAGLTSGAALATLALVDLHRPTAEAERDQAALVSDLVVPALGPVDRVAVHVEPYFEPFAIQTGLVARLDRMGVAVRVPAEQAASFGGHRVADGTDPTIWIAIDHPEAGTGGEVLGRTTFRREDGTVAEVVVTLLPPVDATSDGTIAAP